MNKVTIGILFIVAGLIMGSLSIDSIYNATIGYLMQNKWINPSADAQKPQPSLLGPKQNIYLYSLGLIIIGIFILWTK